MNMFSLKKMMLTNDCQASIVDQQVSIIFDNPKAGGSVFIVPRERHFTRVNQKQNNFLKRDVIESQHKFNKNLIFFYVLFKKLKKEQN